MTSSHAYDERRRFERLKITDKTVAVDESGFQLGRVSTAGGGGMQVDTVSSEALNKLKPGTKLIITVVEPGTATTNSFKVEVRYVDGYSVGMEFL